LLILRRRQTSSFKTWSKALLSIDPEQTPGFRPGKVEGLIEIYAKKGKRLNEDFRRKMSPELMVSVGSILRKP